jgi:hypothetical protein
MQPTQNSHRYEDDRRRNQGGISPGAFIGGALVGAGLLWLYNRFSTSLEEEEKAKQAEEKPYTPINTNNFDHNSEQNMDKNSMLYCPISLELMKDPVMIECGHSFDLESIQDYFRKHSDCPLCRKKVNPKKITRNWNLRQVIEKELKNQK